MPSFKSLETKYRIRRSLKQMPPAGRVAAGAEARNGVRDGFHDVKFYPYSAPGDAPVFAATECRITVVARVDAEKENGVEYLRLWRDPQANAKRPDLCNLTWAKDTVTGAALLCVAGGPRIIRIYNVKTGRLVQTLGTHGSEVLDLKTHPLQPHIIASASEDFTIKIWSLDRHARKSPLQVMIAGSHDCGVSSLAFHSTGRYLLSGSADESVQMWALPPIPSTPFSHSLTIRYPVFESTKMHDNSTDCVAFIGDFILVKAVEEDEIVLWRIPGFDARAPLPRPHVVPPHQGAARSRYMQSVWGRGVQRLRTFAVPEAQGFNLRFAVRSPPAPDPRDGQ